MSCSSLSSVLTPLSEREAVQDALHRGVAGLDTINKTLLNLAFTKDAAWTVNGTILNGLPAIHTG